jgi:hypothetical protein
MCLLDEEHPERQAAAVPTKITAVKKTGELILANAVVYQFWPEIPRHEPYVCVIALRDGRVRFEESSYLSLAKVPMTAAYVRDEATDRQSALERMAALPEPSQEIETMPVVVRPRRPELVPLISEVLQEYRHRNLM